MSSIAPSKTSDPLPTAALAVAPETPQASPAQSVIEHTGAARAELTPGKVAISLDREAQRFVSTLTDTSTEEMLRRYPSESQLAYARAVMAYLRAQISR